ncbi:MAG: hypothetical protein ABI383_04800 [Acidobacteriaceae bacterium]
MRYLVLGALLAGCASAGYAQQEDTPVHITPRVPERVQPGSRSRADVPNSSEQKKADEDVAGPISEGQSSSRETKIDLAPPKGERNKYPDSDVSEDVQEVKPWDPHKAQKDIEVGDFYYKRDNYRGAYARYQDALVWQENNAEAMWKAGLSSEKLGDKAAAARYYARYLKTLPHGDHAAEAQNKLAQVER